MAKKMSSEQKKKISEALKRAHARKQEAKVEKKEVKEPKQVLKKAVEKVEEKKCYKLDRNIKWNGTYYSKGSVFNEKPVAIENYLI
jgi:hypothetical protein